MEKKEDIKRLRRNEMILNSVGEGIYGVDIEGKITFVNPAAAKLLGYEPTELIGEPHHTVIRHGDNEVFWCKDGTSFPVEFTSAPIRNERGELTGTVVIFRDITERKRDEEGIKQSHERLQKALEGIIWATAATVEARDPYTAGHQQRVTSLSLVIANEMQLSEEKKQEIRMAGMVHDLGKICIPSEILSKPGRLNRVEFSMVKMHPQVGHDIFRNIDFPWSIADILLQHHERLDGSGYPRGLKGKDILLAARIIAVADVVEAMAAHRPYRPALGIDKALEEISNKRGILYDPDVVDACLRLAEERRLPLPQLASDLSETIAQAIHAGYRRAQRGKTRSEDPSMAPWDKLPDYLKESNRQQAEHILEKLCRISCTAHKVTGQDIRLVTFTENEVEIMAEIEHQRWNVERLLDGWVWGERRDVVMKRTPYLVPWSELPDYAKEQDRQMVRKIPELLAEVGLEIHRQQGSGC